MTNPTQYTPVNRPETTPTDSRPQQPALTPKPLVITPPVAPQTTGVKSTVETHLPSIDRPGDKTGDKSGEMDSASGGAKTVVAPVDPSRTNVASSAPKAPAPSAPTEPAKASGEYGNTAKDTSNSNASTKQQGC